VVERKKIIWSHLALQMVAEIHEYKASYSIENAEKYVNELFNFVETLQEQAGRCPVCRHTQLAISNYRCSLFKKQHVVIYSVQPLQLNIVAIIHSKRNFDNIDLTEEK